MKFITVLDPEEVNAVADVKAPNCPECGQFMDKVESWVCKKCGELKK